VSAAKSISRYYRSTAIRQTTSFFEIMRTQAETWIPVSRAANLKLE